MKLSNTDLFLIIDPQKDFTDKNGNYIKNHTGNVQIRIALERIQKLIQSNIFPIIAIVYSDYHQNQFKENFSICIPHSFGHKIDLEFPDNVYLFRKSEHDVFSSIQFNNFLNEMKISRILIAGFLAEYCIFESSLSAVEKHFKVCLVTDCIGTSDDTQRKMFETFEILKGKNVESLSSKDLSCSVLFPEMIE